MAQIGAEGDFVSRGAQAAEMFHFRVNGRRQASCEVRQQNITKIHFRKSLKLYNIHQPACKEKEKGWNDVWSE